MLFDDQQTNNEKCPWCEGVGVDSETPDLRECDVKHGTKKRLMTTTMHLEKAKSISYNKIGNMYWYKTECHHNLICLINIKCSCTTLTNQQFYLH